MRHRCGHLGLVGTRPLSGSTNPLPALARWRWRATTRGLVHEAVGTLQGRIMLFVAALALPSLWHLARGDAGLSRADLDAASITGAVVLAHVALAACFVVTLSAQLLKAFSARGAADPFHAHPWVLPDLAALRVAESIAGTALYLIALSYLFHARLLIGPGSGPTILAVHLVVTALWLGALGGLVAAALRLAILRTGLAAHAEAVQRLMIVPFLVVFPLLGVLPPLVHRRAPAALAALGDRAGSMMPAIAPVAVVRAIETGSWATLAAAGSGLLAAGLGASWIVWRWRLHALEELPVDRQVERRLRYPSAFCGSLERESRSPGSAASPFAIARLFWIKDVVVPIRRAPSAYLQSQVVPMALLTAGAIGTRTLGARAGGVPFDDVALDAALLRDPTLLLDAALLASVTWVAAWRSLGSLGEEGEQIALLRAVLSPGRLYLAKLGSAASFAAAHAVVYAGIATGVAAVLGGSAGGGALATARVVGAVVGAVALAFLGTGVGFGLPALRAPDSSPPGASLAGKSIFSFLAAPALAMVVVARWLLPRGEIPGAVLTAGGALAWIGVSAGLAAAAALPRLRRLEA